tara:strand:- start:3898 stop:4704 length:807 start_codon:yes stop_codon:yes gene_type:complete
MASTVTTSCLNGIGLITLNRPEAMNTLTGEMLTDLGAAYLQCDRDDAVKVIVLTGSGKAFCAGADLSAGGNTFDSSERNDVNSCPLAIQAWELRKPIIAACNGHAVGVGLSIAAQCDIRVVANDSKYGFLQNRRGVVTDFGMTALLPKLVGMEAAFELLVRAPKLTGEELKTIGLASRSVSQGRVLEEAMSIAKDMIDNCSPLVMGMHKRLLWDNSDKSLADAISHESDGLNYSMRKPDALEGGVAFFEKRTAVWQATINNDWPEFWG